MVLYRHLLSLPNFPRPNSLRTRKLVYVELCPSDETVGFPTSVSVLPDCPGFWAEDVIAMKAAKRKSR